MQAKKIVMGRRVGDCPWSTRATWKEEEGSRLSQNAFALHVSVVSPWGSALADSEMLVSIQQTRGMGQFPGQQEGAASQRIRPPPDRRGEA